MLRFSTPPLSGKSLTWDGFWARRQPVFHHGEDAKILAKCEEISAFFESKKHAFTLAEVLITLVIVGVVAALTLPTLMTKYQQHVFENQFKKSLYTISQIVAKTRSELGVSKLAQYCVEYNASNGGYYNNNECTEKINKLLIKTSTNKLNNYKGILYTIHRDDNTIRTYNNKNYFNDIGSSLKSVFYVNQLSDGSFLGIHIVGGQLVLSVDLNGYKKPNRLGYDIFMFNIKKSNDTIAGQNGNEIPRNVSDNDITELCENNAYPTTCLATYGLPCNLETTQTGNGIGCAYYALRNKCPYDDTKTYWECLK